MRKHASPRINKQKSEGENKSKREEERGIRK
jgi:hypothetical protein